jgi:microsomal dipeptidase-like Zn-dependent dipeptidase
MLADWHAHYPMRVVTTPDAAVKHMRRVRGNKGVGNKLRAFILKVATILMSNRRWWSGYRVTVEKLREGGVGVALSVLHGPFEELDLTRPYMWPPESSYFKRVQEDLQSVEDEVATHNPAEIRIVHNRAELDRCLADRATALVHCVEGGYHLGDRPEEIERNVAELASKGVAYVTVAHLFYRQVATNAPALPFLKKDSVYRRLFPQPAGEGLAERGIAAVRAMVRNRVLVDLSHMSTDSIRETFRVLDEEDPACEMPVVATHGGYRFGSQEYMLDEETLLQIKRRDGVVGLIMAQYQLTDGICKRTRSFEDSLYVIRRHIDKIAEITGSHRHIAFGTDFDGFIKPTLSELESEADLRRLEEELRKHYRDDEVDLITSGNSIRVLRQLWQ